MLLGAGSGGTKSIKIELVFELIIIIVCVTDFQKR